MLDFIKPELITEIFKILGYGIPLGICLYLMTYVLGYAFHLIIDLIIKQS